MFNQASTFNQNISNWNTAMATNTSFMFSDAELFNQDISGWDVSKVTNITNMFSGASAFNQDISGWTFDTPLTSLSALFRDANAFDQDLSSWDVSGVTSMSAMFDRSGMSKANYDATLSGWAQQSVQSNVTLGAEGLIYCTSASDRQNLIDNNGWTITDAGEQCAPSMVSASLDSDTQITVTFSQNVQTNGTNPTDFTVTDAAGTTYEVTAQADGTAGDTDIVLTVADMSQVTGLIKVTYTNNNNEISDADTGAEFAETDVTGVNIERPFITTWTVTTDDLEIVFPATGNGNNYNIDWGDGSSDQNQTASVSHTYASEGTYIITVSGALKGFLLGTNNPDRTKSGSTIDGTTPVEVMDHSPLPLAVVDSPGSPLTDTNSIRELGSAVPIKVNVFPLVRLSVSLRPKSELASRSSVGASGAVVSTVRLKSALLALVLPAASVAVAVTV